MSGSFPGLNQRSKRFAQARVQQSAFGEAGNK